MNLEAVGMSWSEIAIECGYNNQSRTGPMDGGKTWVHRLKNVPGTEPGFHDGAMLIGLWAEKTRRPLADMPRNEYRYVRNAAGRITALPLIDRPAETAEATTGADSHRTSDAS